MGAVHHDNFDCHASFDGSSRSMISLNYNAIAVHLDHGQAFYSARDQSLL